MSAPTPAIATLAQQFTERFPLTRDGPRTVGREAEFPVVTLQGEAADVRRLWELLMADGDLTPTYEPGRPGQRDFIATLKCEDYTFALEVGLGTVELNTRPCTHLHEIRMILERAVQRLVRAANRLSWRVLAYGIQPLTPPSLRIMAPKERYLSLYRAMGAQWLWYTVTASDQVQVAIARDEMVDLLNYANLMTPVLIALCANSPVYGGKPSQFCSAREGRMAAIYAQEHRHGMLARPVKDVTDFVAMMSETTYLIQQDDGMVIPSTQRFADYLAEHGPDLKAFLYHEHYMWNSARLRAAYGTIEIRPACQQPWREHMAACALGLGMIEGADAIRSWLTERLGDGCWDAMHDYHGLAIRHGLRAPLPYPGLLDMVLDQAAAGLMRRGFGEEIYLTPLYNRLARHMNPAQRLRAVYPTDGLRGLLDYATIPPIFTSQTRLPAWPR